ncbi:MAG: glutamate--cysteine ligase [Gammaproteobacteria bacterium]|nr:glutamate--cysteine ligase [Gammaproteobacteria bacterium]
MPASRIDRVFEKRLAAVINSGERAALQAGRRGVEKESLRVTPAGRIATTPHPMALGSALTNDHITTDYSEALIELVTPTFTTNWELLQYLCDLHQFVYRHIEDELLWATSMPCVIDGDASIPIAQFGPSNVGRMKTIYREGLGLRYGRVMQAISGVHFNYSFPERLWPVWAAIRESRTSGQSFISESYFDLLRNYRRLGWIVLYLFGVSPMVCKSFLRARGETLPEYGRGTAWEPHSTSLRMSDLGYRNRSQSSLEVSVNSLDEYVRDLTQAISTPHPEYQRLGVKVDGAYRQLNANLLQIENEYYAFIRPKRVARSGERPTKALMRRGVEYVEVRALDVSAFDPVGVNQNKLRFLEAFLGLCLMRESPLIDAAEQAVLDGNHVTVARRGREPGLMLSREGRQVPMLEWAREIIDQMQGICEQLDEGDPQKPYSAALAVQAAKLDDVALTPSARLIKEIGETGESFFDLALRTSATHKGYFLDLHQPNEARLREFADQAAESLEVAEAMASAPQKDFDAFLADYFS